MYYIYEISIKPTKEIIYVGKGSGNRYKAKKKNKLLNRLMQDNECDTKITEYFINESDAFERERQRIVELKKIGQAICNNATYSTGGVGYVWDEQRRKKQSENNPMKRPDQRARMSKNNPMHNKETAKAVALKNSKRVIIDNREKYNSLKECAKCYNVSETTISNWIKKGETPKGKSIYSFYEKDKKELVAKKHIEHKDSIIYDGKEYANVKDMAKHLNENEGVIRYWLRKGYSSSGKPCRRKYDEREIQIPKRVYNSKRIPVQINGVNYKSISEACRETNKSRSEIEKLLK